MKTPQKVIMYSKDLRIGLSGKQIVLVGGCFDILHFGHLQFLKAAKKEGNVLIVALEGDEFVKSRKGRKSVHSQDQRAEILAELENVDYVVKLPYFKTDEEYFEMVKTIGPSVIAVTQGDSQMKNKEKQARALGARLTVVTEMVSNLSTSKILKDMS